MKFPKGVDGPVVESGPGSLAESSESIIERGGDLGKELGQLGYLAAPCSPSVMERVARSTAVGSCA